MLMKFSFANLKKLNSFVPLPLKSIRTRIYPAPLTVKHPFYVQLSLNKTCNLKCIFCARQTDFVRNQLLQDEDKIMNIEFLKNHSSLFEFAEYVNLAADGEPLKHPDIINIIKTLSAVSKKPNLIFITNGTLLNSDLAKLLVASKIREVHFSIDSLDEKTSRFIKPGVDLSQLIENIEKINSEKRKKSSDYPFLIMRPTFISKNIKELPEMVDFCNQYGFIEMIVQPMQIYKPELTKYSLVHCKELVKKNIEQAQDKGKMSGVNIVLDPVIKNIDCQRDDDIKNVLAKVDKPVTPAHDIKVKGLRNKCDLPWKFMLIQTNGDVFPCCQSGYYLGNLTNEPWEHIWNGNRARELRKKFIKDILPKECVNQPCGLGKLG